MALLSGKTGAPPAADGAEPMAYEKEAVTTEGGLEATVEVRRWLFAVTAVRVESVCNLGGKHDKRSASVPAAGNDRCDSAARGMPNTAALPCSALLRQQDEAAEANAVAPQMFKSVAGRGHQEFSSNRQQVGDMTSAARQAQQAWRQGWAAGAASRAQQGWKQWRAGRLLASCWAALPCRALSCPPTHPTALPTFASQTQLKITTASHATPTPTA